MTTTGKCRCLTVDQPPWRRRLRECAVHRTDWQPGCMWYCLRAITPPLRDRRLRTLLPGVLFRSCPDTRQADRPLTAHAGDGRLRTIASPRLLPATTHVI